jgi:hypothetical protein
MRGVAFSLSWPLFGLRLVDYGCEVILRLIFGTQPMSFRIIQAHPGDDDLRDTLRLHPAAFTALGLAPGGQVLIDWAGQRTSVRALEDHNPFGGSLSSYVRGVVGVRYDAELPQDFPSHLVARVPAPVRRHLGVPPNTVVVMRRRIRPSLVGQLNQLTMPLAGLVLAAAAVRRCEAGRSRWGRWRPCCWAWRRCGWRAPRRVRGHDQPRGWGC